MSLLRQGDEKTGAKPGASTAAGSPRLPLIPYPASVEVQHGKPSFTLARSTLMVLGEGVQEDDAAVETLQAHLWDLPSAPTAAGSPTGEVHLAIDQAASKSGEGYSLKVSKTAIHIKAPEPAGLFYGVQTLRQLSQLGNGSALLPLVAIEDAPRFRWRGLHLDVSRHFFPAPQVKKLLTVMASLKLNRFHWHLTDDQGWRLPVKGYERLTQTGAEGSDGVAQAYTVADIRAVVRHARKLNIEVLPEVDIPGHTAAAIAAYPELGNTDIPQWLPPKGPIREWGTHEFTLSPSEATMRFLNATADAVADLFPHGLVHIGGDEVSTHQWSRSPTARRLLQSVKIHGVQMYFTRKMAEILQARNRSLVCWDEALGMGGLPSDAIIMAWRSGNEVRKAIAAGRHVVNADQSVLYFDHYQGPAASEPKAFGGFSPLEAVYGFDPMPGGLDAEHEKLVLGGQGELWSEYISTWKHAEYMAFPRSFALAERLWTPNAEIHDFPEFVERLQLRLQDLEHLGVNYRKL